MPKTYDDLPTVPFPEEGVIRGLLPGYLAQVSLEHGPIFKLQTDSEGDFVFMVGPEANRFVLHTHREHFSHRQGWTPILGDWMGQGLLNMDPPEHTLHRRLMNPAFTSSYLASYLPVMRRVVAERTRSWPAEGIVDLQIEAREIAFDVAAAALVGLETGADADRLRELFNSLLHGFDSDVETFDHFLQEKQRMSSELDSLLQPLIAARRSVSDTDQPRDVLAKIIHARDESGDELSDDQLLAHAKILLVAGHETTTTLASWTLALLARWPEHQARVGAELAALNLPMSEDIPLEGLRSLHVLDGFVRETGRLYSPVLNVPRGVLEEFEFGGYVIPKRVPVRLAIAAGHRLPAVFRDPEIFAPERFDPPRDEDARTPYGLITFGAGPRTCIGMTFAQLEVKTLVAHVMRNHRLELVDDDRRVYAGFWTGFVPTGLPVQVIPRHA
jgi:retinoid hydroxylase